MKKILAFIFIVATLTGYIQLFAQTPSIPLSKETTTINNKTFYVHSVKKGQTLYSISKAYNVTVKEIAENNNNILQNIATDVKILIPKQETNIDYGYHYVTKGETLYSISKLYNHTPGELLKLNPGLTTSLTLGQRIRYQRAEEVVSIKTENITKIQTDTKSQKIHIVAKGETVYSLSKTYNIPVDALKQTNPDITEGLQVGQKVIIPIGDEEFKPKMYFYHIIQKSETLFAIAQQYKTDVTNLVYLNPFAKDGLKEGMVLKIEITRFNKNIQEQQHPSDIVFHEVVRGETAYSIAEQYNVAFKKIKKQNTEIDLDALPLGIILKIPGANKSIIEYNTNTTKIIVEKDSIIVARKCKCDSISTDTARTIKIALMLPFLLPENDSIKYDEKIIHQIEKVYPKSVPFIEFYQGALIALDTLKHYGYNVHIKVFDTELDTNKVKSDFTSINKSNTDIIIGPVYYQTFATAQRYAKTKQIPIVSPLAAKNYGLDSNPYIIAANTSNENRIATSALYLSQYVDQNFVVVHNGYITEFEMMNEYKKALSISAHDSIYFNNIVFKVVNFSESGITGVEDALNSKSQNFIIIPSNDQG